MGEQHELHIQTRKILLAIGVGVIFFTSLVVEWCSTLPLAGSLLGWGCGLVTRVGESEVQHGFLVKNHTIFLCICCIRCPCEVPFMGGGFWRWILEYLEDFGGFGHWILAVHSRHTMS